MLTQTLVDLGMLVTMIVSMTRSVFYFLYMHAHGEVQGEDGQLVDMELVELPFPPIFVISDMLRH